MISTPTSASQPYGKEHLDSDKIQTQHRAWRFPSVRLRRIPDFYNAHGVASGLGRRDEFASLHGGPRKARASATPSALSYSPGKGPRTLHRIRPAPPMIAAPPKTLEVMRAEFGPVSLRASPRMKSIRVRIGLKASLVMQEESTSARASVLARSWYNLGPVCERWKKKRWRNIDQLTPGLFAGTFWNDTHSRKRCS